MSTDADIIIDLAVDYINSHEEHWEWLPWQP
jgi:hypothetical protein